MVYYNHGGMELGNAICDIVCLTCSNQIAKIIANIIAIEHGLSNLRISIIMDRRRFDYIVLNKFIPYGRKCPT